ncbi:unnamed protein product [Closterium sp. NIES-54]
MTTAAAATTATATAATAAPACCATMASLRVLAFDHEGRPIKFDMWLDDLQLYLWSDSKDNVSLSDQALGAAPTPPATADSATRSQWLTRNAAAHLAIRNHLPLAKCAHFGQHRTAQALYDAVVARYSLPATAALGRLLLPYLFPELSAFATVEDLLSHLRDSDARYRATVPAEFLDRNPPPMFITLYFIVTRLPDSRRFVRDHFLSLDPTSLTVDLLEEHLLAAETSAVVVGAARGTPRTPFFEGCSPSPLAPSYASAAAANVPGAEDVGAASASVKRHSRKGKGGRGGGGGSGSGGGGSSGGSGGAGGGGGGGTGGGGGGSGGGGGGSGGSGGSGGGGTGGSRTEAQRGGSGGGQLRPCTPSRWTQVAHAVSFVTAPLSLLSLHLSRSDWLTPPGARSLPTVLPCPAIPSGSLSGLHLPSFSTNLVSTSALQDAMVITTTPGCHRESICTCTWTGRHLATLTRWPGSSLYTLANEPPQVAVSTQVSASGPVAPPFSCRLLSHQTLLWHHRLGHPSLPRFCGMHSRLLVSSPPRSLPPLPPSLATPCLPCVEGRQGATPHSSFPPTTAPLQTLHMDVWGPARVSGQGRERYFLLVVEDYTWYTTVFPLRSKGQVVDVLIPWIRAVRLQLRERFRADLPVLRLHSDRGGEFSSDLLRDLCHGEGILQSFTLSDSPQQNGIAERRIGLVMEVARTSMIHAAAPHFLWSFVVQYAAHQLNLWPRVSLPETSPTLRWTGEVGDASVFRDWGSRAFVCDTSADKLSPRAIPRVFLGFVLDAPGWQFYHPTSRCVFPSHDVTFDKSVPFYRLFPYRSAPPPPLPLFLASGPPPVDPPPGGAPCEVAVDSGAARGTASGGAKLGGAATGCAEPGGAATGGAEPGGTETGGVEPGGAEPEGVEPGGAELEGAESGGAEPQGAASSGGSAIAYPRLSPQQLREWLVRRARLRSGATGARGAGAAGAGGAGVTIGAGVLGGTVATGPRGARTRGTGAAATGGGVEPGGAELEGAESGGAEPQGAASSGGSAIAYPRLSPQQLREWLVRRARLRSGATGARGAGAAGAGGAGVTIGAGVLGGTVATGPRGARTRGTGAAATGGVGGAGVGDPTASRASGVGGFGAGDAGAGGAGDGGSGAGGAGAGGSGAVDPGGTMRPRPYFVPLPKQVLGVPSSTGLAPPLLCPPPNQSQPSLQPPSPLPTPSPNTEQTGGHTERREPASRPTSPVHTGRRVPRPRPPPVLGTHAMTLRPSSVPLRVPLPAPPESSLPAVPDPKSDRVRAASPTVSHLFATALSDPSFESTAASALVAELLDFAAACRLDYATALVEDFEGLAAAVPCFASMLLAPEGDPDAPDIPTPRSYAKAIEGPYSSQWQAAMDAKMASWKSTGTYVDEVPPPGANIVDGMWIFRVKRPPGSPRAIKARYVAQGFSQQEGVDYFQTFSPTSKMTTLRPALGDLAAPPTWLHWVVSYDLRQAPHEWHDTLRTTLAALGFAPSTSDPSLFLRTDTSLQPFYVLVYVDDLVFATADTEALTLVKSELQKRHTCTDLGELRSYLGLQITRDRAQRTITLTQSHMVHQVLQRFGFQFSLPQPTPLSSGHSLSAPPSDESVEPSGPYPELMYLMTCTRPDLAYPLSLLARYVAPGRHQKVHWDAAKRVLHYLCSTSGMGLVLGGRGPVVLTGHANASWFDDSATQRSSQGYTFSLGSGSFSWRSTRSSLVLSSSCEAEIYAGAMAAQELRWLTYLLTDLGEQPRSPPVLYVDNKAMIALCQEHRLEHRTKHIALRHFIARELQQRGQLRLAYVATRANPADMFTKALPPGDHQRFSTVLGLVPNFPHLLTA